MKGKYTTISYMKKIVSFQGCSEQGARWGTCLKKIQPKVKDKLCLFGKTIPIQSYLEFFFLYKENHFESALLL